MNGTGILSVRQALSEQSPSLNPEAQESGLEVRKDAIPCEVEPRGHVGQRRLSRAEKDSLMDLLEVIEMEHLLAGNVRLASYAMNLRQFIQPRS